jgi:hypothetical protein
MYVCLYTFSALCCYFFIHFSIPKYELPETTRATFGRWKYPRDKSVLYILSK